MADILKTWPSFMPREKVLKIFSAEWGDFWFTLSRGKPQQKIRNLWFCHQGLLLGHFEVKEIVCNTGQIPKLRSLENHESEWQIKRDRYVARCQGPFIPLSGKPVYHDSFRGFHYFDFPTYSKSMDAKVAI